MIPKVRTWRARFWLDNDMLGAIEVQAPTRLLAAMAVREAPGFLAYWRKATRITLAPRRGA